MRELKRRRGGGDELLAYKRGRRWADLRSEDINAWLKQATGKDVSAKDFRTWAATVLAAVALAVSEEAAATKTGRKRAITRAIKEVAHYLGNTPAVARASYIDPRVFDRYRDGEVASTTGSSPPPGERNGDATAIQGPLEKAVLKLLERLGGALRRRRGPRRPRRASGADREDLIEAGDLERLGDVRVRVDDRQDAVARAQPLDRADEDAERGRVQERRVGQVDDDPGPAGLERLAQGRLQLGRGEQVDLAARRPRPGARRRWDRW